MMIIHILLCFLTLSIGNPNITGILDPTTPPTVSNATNATTQPTSLNSTNQTVNASMICSQKGWVVVIPFVSCRDNDQACLSILDNGDHDIQCDLMYKHCCKTSGDKVDREFCSTVPQFYLDMVPSCDSSTGVFVDGKLSTCQQLHSCEKDHCCPRAVPKGNGLNIPSYTYNSSIPCIDEQFKLEDVAEGSYCDLEGYYGFLGTIRNSTFHMLSSNMSCQNNGECEVGMICVKTKPTSGQCHTVILTIPPPPPTTTTTTTKKTTTAIPEEATTPDPYYSWSAYLARGWERNKVLFYLSIMFTVLGLLGTCFFWLKKKFFKWIMRPDPGEETPSERAMRLAFDLVEERQRQERRRRK